MIRAVGSLSVMLVSAFAQAGNLDIQFVTIADTTTPIPGGVGTFTTFEAYSIDSSGVAFVADGAPAPDSQVGIYLWSAGALHLVADRRTRAPGSSRNFSDLDHVSIENGAVAFHAFAANSGVYLSSGGTLSRIAGQGTAMPGGGQFATTEGDTPISAGSVAFWGSDGAGRFGVYRRLASSTEVLVTEATPIPGADIAFRYIDGGSVAMRNGSTVAFSGIGVDDINGLYRVQNGVVSAVADRRGTLPDGRGDLWVGDFFGGPALDGDQIAFVGRQVSTFAAALYLDAAGDLQILVQSRAPIPGGGRFRDFRSPSLSQGRAVFWGFGTQGEEGIYTVAAGHLDKVIAVGDALDDSTVIDVVGFSDEGIAGNSVVFRAFLADGRQAIYRADLTPKSATLDTDGDSIPDIDDNCSMEGNANQADGDGDGFGDICDNCSVQSNPDQTDSDRDGYGNICDADLNNSGRVTTADYTILRNVLSQSALSSATAAAADLDSSGVVTTADYTILRNALSMNPGPSGPHPNCPPTCP